MATYLILNVLFSCAVLLLLQRMRVLRFDKSVLIALLVLVAATAVFDPIIVMAQIVAYDEAKILDLYLGAAPVEDFFYALLAAFLIPGLWRLFGRQQHA